MGNTGHRESWKWRGVEGSVLFIIGVCSRDEPEEIGIYKLVYEKVEMLLSRLLGNKDEGEKKEVLDQGGWIMLNWTWRIWVWKVEEKTCG